MRVFTVLGIGFVGKVGFMKLLIIALFSLGLIFAQKIPHFLYVNAPILELEGFLSGTLDQNDGQNFKDGSRTEVILAYFEEGSAIEIRLTADFDAYLTLYGPQKTVVATNDDGADAFESLLVTEVPETGRYVLVVSGYSEIDLGNYDLSAKKLEVVDDGDLVMGSSLKAFLSETDDIDSEGKVVDKFVLELSESTNITLQMTSVLMDTFLIIFDENGQKIAENDDTVLEDDPQTTDIDESSTNVLDAQLELSLEPGLYEVWATTASPNTYGFYQILVNSQ